MVTTEIAIGFLAVVVAMTAAVAAIGLGVGHVKAQDAARAGARAAARGESTEVIVTVVRRSEPRAAIDVRRGDGVVAVRVATNVQLPGPFPAGSIVKAATVETEFG